jgi:hypothetical protein
LLYERSGSWAMGFYGSALMAVIAALMAVGLRFAATASKPKTASLQTPVAAR